MPSPCRYRTSHCRKISPGKVAKRACSKTINGASVAGTRVNGHFRPKGCQGSLTSLTRLQAVVRGRSSRKKGSLGKRKGPRKSKRTNQGMAATRLITEI